MENKELIFNQAITEKLDSHLNTFGYKKTEESIGYFKYNSLNNYLKFIFEWNQTQNFYCKLGFEGELIEYSLNSIIHKMTNEKNQKEPEFGRSFSDRIDKWRINISNCISQLGIGNLKNEDQIIVELKKEIEKSADNYNQAIQLKQIINSADEAWNKNDYKLFVKVLDNKLNELPSSYKKKLVIAQKKIKNDD